MTAGNHTLAACSVFPIAVVRTPAALAQRFLPRFKTTGSGAYDQYDDTVLCSAAPAVEAEPDSGQRPLPEPLWT